MTHLLTIDPTLIDWSRAQFALTAIYHWLFVPLTLGLALIMGIMETCYYRTGKQFWKDTAIFWQRLFGVNFAMGVATGIILEFEFGTNWSNYSWFVGDIFGAPLAIEGIVAFFMESTFVAVMYFGWQKVSRGFHLASTWLTGLGATISAWWILVANAWMQYPVGCEFNPDTVRNEMTSFMDVALSPFAVDKFFHTVTSTWVIGAVFVCAVSGWYLLKRREQEMARQSIKIASIVGIVASVLTMATGDFSAVKVAETQPMKLAAMEALYDGGEGVALTAVAAVNPFQQPDYAKGGEAPLRIAIPNGLSMLATHKADGFVPGVNDLLNGYTRADGTRELSAEEKMERGRRAISTLAEYHKLKAADANDKRLPELAEQLKLDIPYFGYGYIKDRAEPGAVYPRQLLRVPSHGGRGHAADALLPRHRTRSMAQGHHLEVSLAVCCGACDAPAHISGERGRMDSSRAGQTALGYSGHAAYGGSRFRPEVGQRCLHVLPLPRALHGAAGGRSEHHVPRNTQL